MAQDGICISEVPEIPRQRSRCFYSALFTIVLPLWSVIPLSWTFVIWSLYTGRIWLYRYPGLALFTGALVEVFFSVYHYQLAQRIASLAPKSPAPTHEIQTAFSRLLKTGLANLPEDGGDHETLWVDRPGSPEEDIVQLEYNDPRAIDFRNCLRTWFKKVPWSHVKLSDVRRWLYWSIFNAKMGPYKDIKESERIHLDAAVELLEKRVGCKIDDSEWTTPTAVEPMRLTVDPVQIVGRPFIFYALIKTMNWTVQKYYESQYGTQYGCHNDLEYLLRIPEGWSNLSPASPLIFIHGLGMGILQYHLLFTHLYETITDRPILILIQPHISQDIFHKNFLRPMDRRETSQRLASLIEALGWTHVDHRQRLNTETRVAALDEDEKEMTKAVVEEGKGVTILSHSNGSYVHAWMLKEHPHLVTRSGFVDPVTFCSWEGDVCYNFIYRAPMTGMELIMKYFVGMELGVANLLQRNFDWVDNSLWFEEIPNARDPSKTMFILGGKDAIVHSQRVRKYLRSHGVIKNLRFDLEAIHGDGLRSGSTGHTEILKWLYEHP